MVTARFLAPAGGSHLANESQAGTEHTWFLLQEGPMRLTWLTGSRFGSFRAPRRRRRAGTSLRVRQLERRRVLDASMQSLLIMPTVPASEPSNTDSQNDALTFDWNVAQDSNESAPSGSGALVVPLQPTPFAVNSPTDSDQFTDPRAIEGNVRPVLVVAIDQTTNEGRELDLSAVGAPPLGLFIDPDTSDSHTATVKWGDGSPTETATIFSANGSGALGGKHTYANEGDYTVTVNLMDQAGGSDSQTFHVTVNNVRPVLVVAIDQTIDEGQSLNLSGIGAPPLGLFIDDGIHDTHTATVNWGDGSATETATVFSAGGSGVLGGSHTYADDGVYTVTVTVLDDFGDSDTQSFGVTVENVAPHATLSNSGPVNEGSNAQVTFSGQTDPGTPDTAAGFRYAYDFNNDGIFDVGDGTYAGSSISSSQAVPAALLDDGPASPTVRARILDKDGGYTDYLTEIDVVNIAPRLVSISGDITDEGDSAAIVARIVDPSPTDAFEINVDWRDGTSDTIAGLGFADSSGTVGGTQYEWTAATREVRLSHRYLDDDPTATSNDTYGVMLSVRDDDGGESGPYTASVVVNNVPPVLVVAVDQTVNEGQELDLGGIGAPPLGLFIDSGLLDTHTATINWGDGSALQIATIFPAGGSGAIGGKHTYADDGEYTVTVTVTDDDGGSDTQSFLVSVNNVRPVLVVAVDQTVDEGEVLNLSGIGAPPIGLFIDPGKLDTHEATIDWGDGSAIDDAAVFFADGAGALGGKHTYADDGVYTVTVSVTDDDGGSDTQSFLVTVNNVAPTLTADLSATTIGEGQALALDALFSDPGFDNELNPNPAMPPQIVDPLHESFTYDIDWGDGRQQIAGAAFLDSNGSPGSPSSGMISTSHIYADDGQYTVTVTVRDDNGGSHTRQFLVTVENVAPTLTSMVPSDTTIDEGQSVSLDALFSDPGFDNELNQNAAMPPHITDPLHESFTYDINWGDGRQTIVGAAVADNNGSPGNPSTGMFSGSHTYADDGVYTVTVTVRDDNGGSHTRQFLVTVENVAPAVANISNLQVNEGSAFSLIGLNVLLADPGFDNAANPLEGGELQELFAVHSINWGDGKPTDFSSASIVNRVSGAPGISTTAQFAHAPYTYADDGDYTVTVRVADDDMGAFANPAKFMTGVAGVDFIDLTFMIHVNNVAPTLTNIVPSETTINESEGISFTSNFSDPGFDNELNPNEPAPLIADPRHESFTYDIDWGDGRQELAAVAVADLNGSAGTPSSGTFGGSHIYTDDGVYTVTLTIHDDNGGQHVRTFLITVDNIDPSFVPAPGGASFVGDDVSSEGITTIYVSFSDPGFDNPSNPNLAAPPSITDTLHESFTHLLNWGDGTIDAVHTYAESGVYTVTVTVLGPSGMESFTFEGFNSSLNPVLTLVGGQAINDPAVPAQLYTFLINWGDGAVQTVPLMLKAPGDPLPGNGLTTVFTSLRTPGEVADLTDGSFQVQHRYLAPPNPANATADIPITVTVMDDNNGSVSDFILVSNPGIQTPNVAIDTTPDVPRLEILPAAQVQQFVDQATSSNIGLQATETRLPRSELLITTDLYLELEVVSPDGEVISTHRIRDEALFDLRALFQTLPDGRYRIFLVRTENNSRRLIMEVYVRRGRVIDPSDDSEGTRDRPPTSEEAIEAVAVPLDENPLLQPSREALPPEAPNAPADGESNPQANQNNPRDGEPTLPEVGREPIELTISPRTPVPSPTALRWMAPLAGLALAATQSSGNWSNQVDTALQQAENRQWRRLRRAGRLEQPVKNQR
jgi:PKD repeat protein